MKQLAALAQQKQLQTPADISPRKTHGKRQERTQAGPHPLPSPAATGSTPTSKRCQRDCMEMENAMRSAKGAPRHAHAALPGMPAYFQSSAAKGSQSFHCCYNRSAGGIFPMSQEWIFKLNAPANASFPKQAPMGWTRSAPRGPPCCSHHPAWVRVGCPTHAAGCCLKSMDSFQQSRVYTVRFRPFS